MQTSKGSRGGPTSGAREGGKEAGGRVEGIRTEGMGVRSERRVSEARQTFQPARPAEEEGTKRGVG